MTIGLSEGFLLDNKAGLRGYQGVMDMELCKRDVGRKVVSLARYQNDTVFPIAREVEAYWEGLRAGRDMPLRSEVDPRGIERALEFSFILERIAPGHARFRLAGQHLNALLGMEVRGMPVTALFRPEGRKSLSAAMEEMFENKTKVELDLVAEHGIGKPHLEAKLLILPLKSDLGDVSRGLGCLVSHGRIGRVPRRFEIAQVASQRARSAAMADEAAQQEFAEAPQMFRGAPSPKERPHLRVIKTDD